MATFRQTTSRADDPQIHTHAVISAKVQTADGRWLALDARYLKRHQRMLGGLYQSVLRAELTHRLGVEWRPIVNGQAEIAGVPDELLAVFSKRTADIDEALADKLDEFRRREGREPSRWERAALTREASADTRSRKSGNGAADLTTRWRTEAADAGWTVELLDASIDEAAAARSRTGRAAASWPMSSTRCRSSGRRGPGPMSCRRSATCNGPCRNSRDTAGPPPSSGPPTTSSTSSSTSTRPATPAVRAVGRPVGVDRADRTPLHVRGGPRPGGGDPHVGDGRPSRPARPVARPSTATVSIRCRPTPPQRWPATTGSCSSSARPAPARPACSPPPPTTSHAHGRVVFAVAPTAKAARTVERDTGIRSRHGRQAAPRVAAHRPATAARVPAARRDDADRRRGRHAVDPRPPPARHARRPEPLAARARR